MNRFDRTLQLVGNKAFEKLSAARIAVFGLGGVGSYAVEALARAGVGGLRLVDFDVVHETNINRQLFALESTCGKPKVIVAQERVCDINPHCIVETHQIFADGETLEKLLLPPLDAVIDSIDSISPKALLIQASVLRKIFTITCMGAAARTDPGTIVIDDIAQSHGCPLARFVRKRLHRLGIFQGVRCVYSSEKARNKLPAPAEETGEEQFLRGRRRVPLGSISYMPAIFGLKAASEAIRYIIDR